MKNKHSIRVSPEALLSVIIALEKEVRNLTVSYDNGLVVLFDCCNEVEDGCILVDSRILKADPRVLKDTLPAEEFSYKT